MEAEMAQNYGVNERTKDRVVITRIVKHVAIMFSEYYFYLKAFIDDEVQKGLDVVNDFFQQYIDCIKRLKGMEEGFHILYRSRFEEGKFLKRVQFMYEGK